MLMMLTSITWERKDEYFITSVSPSGLIHLGPGIAPLAAAARRELHSYLEQLAKEVDETVDLAVLDEDQVFFLDQVTVSRRLRAVSTVGSKFPLYCTANAGYLRSRCRNTVYERQYGRYNDRASLNPFLPQ
jgi:DNA-binding IclR family transcriptional regulator